MGFNILKAVNIFGHLVEAGKLIYDKFLTPDDGDHTDLTINTGFTFAFTNLMPRIDKYIAEGKLTTKEQIDNFFDRADDATGSEAGAIRMFPGMPADKEEDLTDSLFGEKGSARLYAYHKAKVDGYFIE